MALFGKNWKKTKFDKMDELFDAHDAPQKTRLMIKTTDTLTRFEKNADGSIQYIVMKDGQTMMSQKMLPNVESDFATPDGMKATITFQIKDNGLLTVISFADGTKLYMDRELVGNTLKQTNWKDNMENVKGTIYYEQV